MLLVGELPGRIDFGLWLFRKPKYGSGWLLGWSGQRFGGAAVVLVARFNRVSKRYAQQSQESHLEGVA